ncbi:MAG: hypothetical protein P1P64_02765 [Treponemataceae bacterium]
MGKRKICITVTDEQYKALSEQAQAEGLCRVSVFVKSRALKSIQEKASLDKKTIIVPVQNYQELAGYVEQKRFGSIASFCTFALEQHMQRNPLTEAQIRRAEKSIKEV